MAKYTELYKNTAFKKVEPKTFNYGPMSHSDMEKEVYYPTFTVPMESIPEAKKWEVGKTYKIAMEVVQKGMFMDNKRSDVTFEIRKIKPI